MGAKPTPRTSSSRPGPRRVPILRVALARAWVGRGAGGHHLGIRARFALVLAAGMLLLAGVGATGVAALVSARGSLGRIYTDSVVTTEVISNLAGRLDDAEEAALYGLVTVQSRERQLTATELESRILPNVAVGIANTTRLVADNPAQVRVARRLSADWAASLQMLAGVQFENGSLASRSTTAAALKSVLDRATSDAHQLAQSEGIESTHNYRQALAAYHADLRLVIAAALITALVVALLALWLVRGVLPRTLAYSRFAQRLVDGDYSARLEARGDDELTLLGRTLDEVARRHREEDSYDRTQAEFSDALQLTGDERDAQDLLRRHLERCLAPSTVTVLNRNNSADRLEPVTELAAESPLRDSLRDASPRSCLAIRSATIHTQTHGQETLVSCEICSACDGHSTCMPLLVGGEVIGSVLVNHHAALQGNAPRRLRESVRQAAPVVANLRNLAISQTRASTDTLTGLPNRRALDDTIKRMVAQASRTNSSLAALMLDLDHFKKINDEHGHAKGDEILAGFGTQLEALLRASDFAARYGGEEFVVLLPATDTAGAVVIAEKLRVAVRDLHVPHVDRTITTSIGVAVLPDHALDAATLERAADRALYLAKTNGRDRVEVATLDEISRLTEPTSASRAMSPSARTL